MLQYLSFLSKYPELGFLRLFDYVSFRAGGAGFTAFMIVMLLGPWTVRMLKRFRATAPSRYGGLVAEFVNADKDKTPSMGGILIVGAIVVAALLWMRPESPLMWVLTVATVLFALIGFTDDFAKVAYKQRDGVPGKVKLLGQTLIAVAAVLYLDALPESGSYMREWMVPFSVLPVGHGCWVFVIAVIAVVGASNAVNLTDGKDGLSTGCMIFATLTYAAIAYFCGHKLFAEYLRVPFLPEASEAVVFAAAVIGSCIGFLWYNCFPASMFMGDTGSLALGGIIGLLAVLVRQEVLLILVGGVFVMEAGSVMLQVGYFKLTHGKRIFLCTPIHHHFEKLGWKETQIVVRFWILAGVFALLALGTLKLR